MNEHLLYRAFTRDLEWILNTPPLLVGDAQLFDPQPLRNLDLSIVRPDPERLHAARSQKLGYYFEFLVRTLFEAHPDYSILAENRIIQGQQQTLGELDLLIQHHPCDDILHLELALKFYLAVPGPEQAALSWVGAGLKDFFHAKLHRLYHHQLQLPAKAQQAGCWPADLPYPQTSQLWMPGRLYLPGLPDADHELKADFPQTPWSLNPQAHCSYWFEAESWAPEQAQALNKADWLNGPSQETPHKPLPAQFAHPNYESPIYVVPFHWHSNALRAIHHYQQTL